MRIGLWTPLNNLFSLIQKLAIGVFPGVQWLRLHASSAGGGDGMGSIPSQGTKIPHTMECGQKFKNNSKIG